ncbi:MAG TPA: hypothetical protein PK801_06210 [Aggregatilineales bacterium]|nr:hypothetical protein [Chloroflexota bacterium]HOA22387.1 hypothetical protein [Aggregatilineales bacterium]HQA67895.1 hypothetical protein [Aggregatilineales bacterium]
MAESMVEQRTDPKLFGLSVISAMRGAAGPALLAQDFNRRKPPTLAGTQFDFLASETTAGLLSMMAVGEMVLDKMPFAPARISPLPLAGRMASGALVGAALSAEQGEDVTRGAIRAALITAVATFVLYFVRIVLGKSFSTLLSGMLEDAVVLAYGWSLIERP